MLCLAALAVNCEEDAQAMPKHSLNKRCTSGGGQMRIALFAAILAVALLALFTVLVWGIVIRQDYIREQGRLAQSEGLNSLFEQQRLSTDLSMLHFYAQVSLHSSRPYVRALADQQATALAETLLQDASPDLRGHIMETMERLRLVAERRTGQVGLVEKISERNRLVHQHIWELLEGLDSMAHRPAWLAILDFARAFEATMERSFRDMATGRKELQELITRVSSLCQMGGIAENPWQQALCRDIVSSLEVLDPLYATYLEAEGELFPKVVQAYPELRQVSEMLSWQAAATINTFLNVIISSSERAADSAQAMFIGIAAVLVVLVWGVHRYLISPLLWISNTLERIRRGEPVSPRPCIRLRELGQVADLLGEVQAYLGTIIEHSNLLESEKRKYAELSIRDGLTGVYNRRYFDVVLAREWHAARTRGTPLSLVLLDVDHFKKYNDTFGHLQGDDCLRAVARAVQAALLRPGDEVMRYGGEEFAVLLPGADKEGARHMAERIRQNVQDLGLPHPASSVAGAGGVVTVSIGISVLWPHKYAMPAELVRMADEALYAAKNGGRNRVSLHECC